MQTSKIKNIRNYAIAYLMWIVSFLLWLLFMLLGRNSVMVVLAVSYDQTLLKYRMATQLVDRVFMFSTGIIWLILMVVVEQYFRRGVQKGNLAQRVGRVMAPIIFLIFIADFAMILAVGFTLQPMYRFGLLLLELAAGIVMAWLGRKRPEDAVKPGHIGKLE